MKTIPCGGEPAPKKNRLPFLTSSTENIQQNKYATRSVAYLSSAIVNVKPAYVNSIVLR